MVEGARGNHGQEIARGDEQHGAAYESMRTRAAAAAWPWPGCMRSNPALAWGPVLSSPLSIAIDWWQSGVWAFCCARERLCILGALRLWEGTLCSLHSEAVDTGANRERETE